MDGYATGSPRQALAELAGVEPQNRLLAESASDIIYLYRVEPDPGFEYVSPSMARITGYDPQEFELDPDLLSRIVHPHDASLLVAMFRTPAAFSEPVMLRLLHREGNVVWTEHRIAPLYDATSEVLAIEGIARDVTERTIAEDELWRTVQTLRRSDEERRRLLGLLVDAEQRERRELAADLHDDAIQVLSAALIRLGSLRLAVAPEARGDLETLELTLRQATERLRHLMFELRPPGLDSEGLAASLRALLVKFQRETGIEYWVDDSLDEEPPAQIRATLYRIAQEALANVRKHSRAGRVDLLLTGRDDGYAVRVEDDGVGFGRDVGAALPGHVGLPTMRERAELVGGWCTIHSAPGAGCTVEVWVPRTSP
jgi:PAS domain S-box-containing protein